MNAKCRFRNKSSTGLEFFLKENKTTDVFIAGLATDYCVNCSVLDACRLGFNTFVIKNAVRGIDLNPGDIEKAFKEMKNAGPKIIESSVIMRN